MRLRAAPLYLPSTAATGAADDVRAEVVPVLNAMCSALGVDRAALLAATRPGAPTTAGARVRGGVVEWVSQVECAPEPTYRGAPVALTPVTAGILGVPAGILGVPAVLGVPATRTWPTTDRFALPHGESSASGPPV